MFLDFSCLFAKKYDGIKKERSFDATSLFECPIPNIQWPLPSVQPPTTPPLPRPPNPSPAHSLSPLSPDPHLSTMFFFLFFFFEGGWWGLGCGGWGEGVSAVTSDVKPPRVCSPLCSDHLWQMTAPCAQRRAVPSPSNLPPLSERDGDGGDGGGGVGGGCKRWEKWCRVSPHDKPGGRRVLVAGLLCPVTAGPLLRR